MIQNKIVIHYQDRRLAKGITNDFFHNKDTFHLIPADTSPGAKPLDVWVPELKAVFFVRKFDGNSQYHDKKEFDPVKNLIGRKMKVAFKDGELMVGVTNGYEPGQSGFFLSPADTQSNTERCFVVKSATREVSLL